MQPLPRVRILLLQYYSWQGLIKTQAKSTIKRQIEYSSTYIAQGVEQSAIEEIRKE